VVPHSRDSRSGAKTQEAAQLLANREPLLRRQNHTGMLPPGAGLWRVKSIGIGHVERGEGTFTFGGEGQLNWKDLPAGEALSTAFAAPL
jgi:hypothetical protein